MNVTISFGRLFNQKLQVKKVVFRGKKTKQIYYFLIESIS